jgi:hypothetical protein
MKKSADLLCILIMFSIRADFYKKSLTYAKAGYLLFPEDIRFTELYAYALVLSEEYEAAEGILAKAEFNTCNIAFLRGRVSVMLELPTMEKRSRISGFLNYWTEAR